MNATNVTYIELPCKFVAVVVDGPVYRWRRNAGPGTTFISREGFTTLQSAIEAAQVIAACYGVPMRRTVALEVSDNYVPFQMPKEAYSAVEFEDQREDWIGE